MRTYGTLQLIGGKWVVNVQPHIAIRLKRLFPRISKHAVGPLEMSPTDEVCSELLWFMQRYPLEVNKTSRKLLENRAAKYQKHLDNLEQLINGAVDARRFELALPPRDYQRVAADLLLRAGGLLCADDVGLGKTVTTICALTEPSTLPALIVTLAHLPRQWEAEVNRFAPSLRVHVIKSSLPYDIRAGAPNAKKTRQMALVEPEFPHVIICNYHKLAGWADSLAGIVKLVAFDEVQELRKDDTHKYKAAKRIAGEASYRLGLSATPIYNMGGEFFNVLEVLRPGELGSRTEFGIEWGGMHVRDPQAFGTYLREKALMLRRTRKEVGRELPPLSRSVQHCESEEDELKKVEGAAIALARIILSRSSSWHERGEATREIDWRLRQATGIAKAPHVMAFVRLLVESGERVVLYGWHRAVYEMWMEGLADLKPVLFTGSESPAQKQKSREAFVKGDASVLVMSLRAGAGLDGLQHVCRTVVFGELDWSPGVHEQCEGRVFRDGQAEPVTVFYLVADEGSDPIVSDVLGLKRGQIEGVRDPDADLIERLDPRAEEGIKRLAERYLARANSPIREEVAAQ